MGSGFFFNPEVTLGTKLLEIVFMVIGAVVINMGITALLDKENKKSLGTAIFWCSLGIVMVFGRWIPPMVNGILVVVMTIPAIFKQVGIGKVNIPDSNYSKKKADEIGVKIFIPAFSIGICAIGFAIFTKISALVGVTVGVLIGIILLMIFSKDNKPKVFLDDSRRMLGVVGPLSMLPMLLAALGALFTEAGVGDVVAGIVGNLIPAGNVNIGIIVFGIGMMLFTMIMGNAYAAITVMTVGIGAPFVLKYGANPVVIGMTALTCGFCGTLMTPMAANFNIVPVALLDMKDRNGVIKNQAIIAIFMLVVQIIYMIVFK